MIPNHDGIGDNRAIPATGMYLPRAEYYKEEDRIHVSIRECQGATEIPVNSRISIFHSSDDIVGFVIHGARKFCMDHNLPVNGFEN